MTISAEYIQAVTEKFNGVLIGRGIDQETAQLFEIGLLTPQVAVGFFGQKVPEKFVSRNGVIFPIKNLYGDTVSYYLKLPKNQHPKYDSVPFEKSLLFGLHQSWPYVLRAGYAIVVEGPMDFFVLWAYGIRNVVAILGTSMNRKQTAIMKRFTDKCFILFDGDTMGRVNAKKTADDLSEFHVDATIIELPPGYDPDDYVRQYGRENLVNLLNNP